MTTKEPSSACLDLHPFVKSVATSRTVEDVISVPGQKKRGFSEGLGVISR